MTAAMSNDRSGARLDKKIKNLSETKRVLELDQDSGLSSLTSSDESDKLGERKALDGKNKLDASNKPDESNSVPCHACKLLELKSLELKKQREDLKRSLLLHLKNHHATKKPRTGQAVKNEIVQESKQGDAPSIASDPSHNLRSISERSLCKLVPIFKNHTSSLLPEPEPTVKRLKGELAKSIGQRIDGCNMNILNPYSGDNLS